MLSAFAKNENIQGTLLNPTGDERPLIHGQFYKTPTSPPVGARLEMVFSKTGEPNHRVNPLWKRLHFFHIFFYTTIEVVWF